MPSRRYQIYSNTVTSASNTTNIEIARDGFITSVLWTLWALGGAGVDSRLAYEVSLQGVTQIITNDADRVISGVAAGAQVASSVREVNVLDAGLRLPVNAGDRLYLNVFAGGTAWGSGNVRCLVNVEDR